MSTLSTGSTSGGVPKSSGLVLDEASVSVAWSAVRSSEEATFLVLSYVPSNSKNEVKVLYEGIGGLVEVKDFLAKHKDKVCFGGYKNVANGGKFDRFFCVGEEVGALAKGRGCMHKNGVFAALPGAVNDVTID